jgi:hypothetical protein
LRVSKICGSSLKCRGDNTFAMHNSYHKTSEDESLQAEAADQQSDALEGYRHIPGARDRWFVTPRSSTGTQGAPMRESPERARTFFLDEWTKERKVVKKTPQIWKKKKGSCKVRTPHHENEVYENHQKMLADEWWTRTL